jgi:hypothetical protein
MQTPLECLTGPGLPTDGADQPVLLFATPQRNAPPLGDGPEKRNERFCFQLYSIVKTDDFAKTGSGQT